MPQQAWVQRLNFQAGKKIREARENLAGRVTQGEIAARTEGAVSRSSIANIESGRQGLTLRQLFVLAKALAVSPSQLLPATENVFGQADDPLASERRPAVRNFVERGVERISRSETKEG